MWCDHTTTNDAKRPERPIAVTTHDIINKIHDVVMTDCRVKIYKIGDAMHISTESVFHILHDVVSIKKLSARWVPQLLTIDQKRNCVTTSEQCLLNAIQANFCVGTL